MRDHHRTPEGSRAAVPAPLARARPVAPLFEVEEERLPNGITLLLAPDPEVPVFTIMLWVPAGRRTEAPGGSGISHYLEHCFSLGTRKLAPREIDRIVQDLGGRKNAGTGWDYTCYYESLPSAGLERIIAIEADRFVGLAPPTERLASELDVVREERRRMTDNSLWGTAFERLIGLAWPDHPYGRHVVGTAEDLAAMTPEKLLAYYRRHYTTDNATYVLAGGFDPAQARRLFADRFSGIPRGRKPVVEVPVETNTAGEHRAEIRRRTARLPRIAVCWMTVDCNHEDVAALDVLVTELADGRASRFDRVLQRDRQLIAGHDTWLDQRVDGGALFFSAEARPGVTPAAIESALGDLIEEVVAAGVAEPQRLRALRRSEIGFLASMETTHGRARALGLAAVTSRRGWRDAFERLDRLREVTSEDLRRVAARYLVPERRRVVIVYPEEVA